jgi:hypothetical protein
MTALRENLPTMSMSLSMRVLAFCVLCTISTAILAVPYLSIQ